jgi:hypothetical protein
MRRSCQRILRNASARRKVTGDEIAIVARRSHDHALGIQRSQNLENWIDRRHVLCPIEDREIIAPFQVCNRSLPKTILQKQPSSRQNKGNLVRQPLSQHANARRITGKMPTRECQHEATFGLPVDADF